MKLFFDDGIKEFETNNGQILRFNPSDPAFYDRFRTMITKIEKAETELDVAVFVLEGFRAGSGHDFLFRFAHELFQALFGFCRHSAFLPS